MFVWSVKCLWPFKFLSIYPISSTTVPLSINNYSQQNHKSRGVLVLFHGRGRPYVVSLCHIICNGFSPPPPNCSVHQHFKSQCKQMGVSLSLPMRSTRAELNKSYIFDLWQTNSAFSFLRGIHEPLELESSQCQIKQTNVKPQCNTFHPETRNSPVCRQYSCTHQTSLPSHATQQVGNWVRVSAYETVQLKQ